MPLSIYLYIYMHAHNKTDKRTETKVFGFSRMNTEQTYTHRNKGTYPHTQSKEKLAQRKFPSRV